MLRPSAPSMLRRTQLLADTGSHQVADVRFLRPVYDGGAPSVRLAAWSPLSSSVGLPACLVRALDDSPRPLIARFTAFSAFSTFSSSSRSRWLCVSSFSRARLREAAGAGSARIITNLISLRRCSASSASAFSESSRCFGSSALSLDALRCVQPSSSPRRRPSTR